jgi:hypothetical protein
MYNPVILDAISHEQNRRLEEQRSIAQAYNQAEQKGKALVGVQRAFYRFLKRTVLSRLVRQEFEEQEQKYYLVRKEG